MRVTGGRLGGRTVRVPQAGVRPMQDRVRQALFSILGERILGCRFLDLFAGSGVVGIEAWSRGAAEVWWVERDGRVYTILKENVENLCWEEGEERREGLRLIRADVWRFLSKPAETSFDIIFIDPPFMLYEEGVEWVGELLAKVGENGFLKSGGVFVMEGPSWTSSWDAEGWRVVWEKRYGQNKLIGLARSGR